MLFDLQHHINKAMSYRQYHDLLQDLWVQGKTTGNNQSEAYLGYAKLNLQRMQRLEKTTELTAELKAVCANVHEEFIWLVITEGWCGDASQNLPVFEKIELARPHITLKLVLRDENPELMDRYLTNGTCSIPKLICIKKETGQELFIWGPRPTELQHIVTELKNNHVSSEEKSLIVQKWYNADKTQSVQKEFTQLVSELI